MYCIKCGSQLPDDKTHICPSCGTKQEEVRNGQVRLPAATLILVSILALLGCGGFFLAGYLSSDLRAERLITRGGELLSEKDYAGAEKAFKEAAELTPDSVEAYKGLVKIYEKTEDDEALIDVLNTAVYATGDEYFAEKLEEAYALCREESDDLPGQDPLYTEPVEVTGDILADATDVTLTLCVDSGTYDAYRDAFEAAVGSLSGEYPGIILDMTVIEGSDYDHWMNSSAAAGDLPDILCNRSGTFLGDLAEAGMICNLDAQYDAYRNELPETMLSSSTFHGSHYGVPFTYDYIVLYANMDLLNRVGCHEIPGTYDELIECCEALKAEGIIPFGCSLDETWCVSEVLETIMLKEVGCRDLNKIFLGRGTWENDGIAGAVDIYRSMIESGYFDPEGYDLYNDSVVRNFADGKYAFYIGGTWNIDYYDLDDKNIFAGEFPVINKDSAAEYQFIGGPSDVFAVSARSDNRDIAAEYVFRLGKMICYYNMFFGEGMPAWIPDGDTYIGDSLAQRVAQMGLESAGFVLYGDTAMRYGELEIYNGYLKAVSKNAIDGKEFSYGLAGDIR